MNKLNTFQKIGLAATAMVLSGAAMAGGTTFDTSDLLTDIAAAGLALAAVAAAIVAGPRLLKAAWGWIRGTVR